MAKKTAAKKPVTKKPRRRLKRTARRSLAVVLMITAVVVAAIPVPENQAETGGNRAAGDPFAYEEADTKKIEDGGDYVDNTAGDHAYKNEVVSKGALSANLKAAIADKKLQASVKLRSDVGGRRQLDWEYLYEHGAGTSAKLVKYNDMFSAPQTSVGIWLIKDYHTVSIAQFNKYFSDNPDSYNDPKNPMDNLGNKPNTTTRKDLHPAEPVTYTCDMALDMGTVEPLSTVKMKFLEEYFGDKGDGSLTEYRARCKTWQEQDAAWKKYDKEKAAWDLLSDAEREGKTAPTEPTFDRPTKPLDFVRTPNQDLRTTSQKMQFYLEHNNLLKNNEYALEEAFDYRLTAAGENTPGTNVYVVRGTVKPETLDENTTYDIVDGYVVELDGKRRLTVIGAKAFAGIGNVGKIDIDENINVIGDEAFASSSISSIHFGSATTIGNKAFEDCTLLTTATFGEASGALAIGAEAFRGSGLTAISFPYSVSYVGHGAFSDCPNLTTVDFTQVKQKDCIIKDYAFFDDTSLMSVKFDGPLTDICGVGKGCFAVTTPSTALPLANFVFPKSLIKLASTSNNSGEGLGDYVLANRQSLQTVTMPDNYRDRIPDNTFYNCNNLQYVVFPETCTTATYCEIFDDIDKTYDSNKLFRYVTNENFYVRGPELDGDDPAGPRVSTWYASTRVSGENGVPYIYKDRNGKECYEVAMKSEDGSLYRYEASQDGTLMSCVLIRGKDNVDIIIPSQIGNIKIKSIGGDCFADPTLRSKIRSITVRDDSISTIGAEAFKDLPKLRKVRIGNSITDIGDRAFANCKVLENVYFTKPAGGYASLKMADSAFATEGAKLTFHGDIVEGYGPFDWAMNSQRLLKNENDNNTPEVNVCYQSLWDSENGTHLTVMVDRQAQADGKHDVVLLDYPKLSDLLDKENLSKDEELKDYCSDMERYYYYSVYDNGAATVRNKDNKTVDQLRTEYADIWDTGVSESDSRLQAVDGPWINPTFCENWANYRSGGTTPPGGDDTGSIKENSLYKFFFEPLVVEAAADTNPRPYFERHPYSFVDNYLNMQKDDVDPNKLADYETVPVRAQRFIDGTEHIVIPAGVTSIDARKYGAEGGINWDNYDVYIKGTDADERNRLHGSDGSGTVPGLFSGRYKDYTTDDDSLEKDVDGNDLIKTVEMSTVRYLPDYAFDSCEQLESVKLGTLKEVGALPFRDCGNLINVEGSEDCPANSGIIFQRNTGENGEYTYKLVECLLKKGDGSTGVEGLMDGFVNAGTSDCMSGITEIAKNAFDGCKLISTVDLSGSTKLKEIPEDCFKDCTALSTASLPVSVNKIKEGAFSGKEENYPLDVWVRGREVDIADEAFDPKNRVTIHSYKDSAAERYALRYYDEGVRFEEIGSFRVMFFDYDGKQIGLTQELTRRDNEEIYAKAPVEAQALYEEGHRPGYIFKGEWAAYSSDGTRKTLEDPITEDLTTFVAQYESDGTLVGGKYVVEFIDGVDGAQLAGRGASEDGKYYIDPSKGNSFADMGWTAPIHPVHEGYKEAGFRSSMVGEGEWTVDTEITSSPVTVVAIYEPLTPGTSSGGSTNTSGGTTNTSGGTTNTSSSSTSSSSSSSSTSSSSTSTTSTTSGAGRYTVFVENGSGSGSYMPGETVIVTAVMPAAGMRFDKWTTDSNGVTLTSASMTSTTFKMPSNDVAVRANFVADTTPRTAAAPGSGSGGNTNTSNNDNGNTRVDIEKPGISNRDLATANVNGSTDNFIVKITETDEATRAVAAALTNKYGTLDNILYYAMDISLYDSTGTTKISDTTGLTVDITIPIPDSLVAYGGNNMAGAVINGDQLENLNESFTTINGVPCIRFRATHFSPYTVYVDTGNLVEGMLDTTPKTGDPIHPKWFLSLGLACLSIILFMKRDKKTAVKVKS